MVMIHQGLQKSMTSGKDLNVNQIFEAKYSHAEYAQTKVFKIRAGI